MRAFISYTQRDHRLMHALAGALHDAGIEPVVAVNVLTPGARLDDKVRSLIGSSDAVVVLATSAGASSQWVQQEVGCARALEKHVVPLKTRNVTLGAMFQGYEYFPIRLSAASADFVRLAYALRGWASENDVEVRQENAAGVNDHQAQILHLPSALVCPACGKVENHVWLCLLCGDWVCVECGETIPPTALANVSSDNLTLGV